MSNMLVTWLLVPNYRISLTGCDLSRSRRVIEQYVKKGTGLAHFYARWSFRDNKTYKTIYKTNEREQHEIFITLFYFQEGKFR